MGEASTMGICPTDEEKVEENMSAELHLTYFPIAARGEISRMICAIGGLEPIWHDHPFGEKPDDHAAHWSPGTVPLLKHGDIKVSQSLAIENYLSSSAPKYKGLTPAQRCKDLQLSGIKDDLVNGIAPIIFGERDAAKCKEVLDKFYPILEGILPEEGFVNGLEFPTMGDFAVLLMCEGYMPYVAGFKCAGDENYVKQYPK